MADVQIRCPNSGLWAWTDVDVDRVSWKPTDHAGRELRCGVCGERHLASARGLRVPDWSPAAFPTVALGRRSAS